MNKACIVVHPIYKGKKLFDLNDAQLNRDNCLLPFVKLKQRFQDEGIELVAVESGEEASFPIVIYNEMPNQEISRVSDQTRYLMIFESELICPNNWKLEFHSAFNKVFTWHDDFVNGKNYIKFNFPQNISSFQEPLATAKLHFCTLIAGNKSVRHPLELYSERIKAIRWFEKNHPDHFDLFGVGWDRLSPKH